MSDDNEIIDVEAVEVEDADNLPALAVERASSSEPIELPNRQDALLDGNPERRCVATNSRGQRCRKFAIYGATVCRTHGGATRKVKEAARIRVENASNRLMGKLIEFAFDDTKPPDVQLKAIQNSLDRAGLKPPAEVVLSQVQSPSPFEQVWDSIGGSPPDESLDASSGYGAAGQHASPAPAYESYADRLKAEAGGGVSGYGDTGQYDEHEEADQEREPSWHHGPPPHGHSDGDAREGQPQPLSEASSQDRPARREAHITGMAAIRMANQANRDSGVWQEQRAIESPHKRYRRP